MRQTLQQRVRRMMEAAEAGIHLLASEQRLEEVRRIGKLGDWEWDPDTQILALSDEAQETLRISDRVHLGRWS